MLPLKITDTSPGNVAVLNRWADEKNELLTQHKNLLAQHTNDIATLKTQIAALIKKTE